MRHRSPLDAVRDFDPLSPAAGAGSRLALSAGLLALLWAGVAWAMTAP